MKMARKRIIIKQQITDILNREKFGSSAQTISDELNLARNTVIKYLEILKKEQKAFEWNIGRYRIWISQKVYSYLNELQTPQDYVVYDFLHILMKELFASSNSESFNWKKLGENMTDQIDWESHFPTDYVNTIKSLYHKDPTNLDLFVEYYPGLFESTLNMLGDSKAKIEPPIVNYDPPFTIFRIENSMYISIPNMFEIICGIKETELQQFYPHISVNIHAIHKSDRYIDVKFSFS